MSVKIALLGEVTAEVDQQLIDRGTPRQRCVLATLGSALATTRPTNFPGRRWLTVRLSATTTGGGSDRTSSQVPRLFGWHRDTHALANRLLFAFREQVEFSGIEHSQRWLWFRAGEPALLGQECREIRLT